MLFRSSILEKMGMLVHDGKLHLIDRNSIPKHMHKDVIDQLNNNSNNSNNMNNNVNSSMGQNNYIYNKYFKESVNQEPKIRRPKSLNEYIWMLIDDERKMLRNREIKSTKLIMPTSNINMGNGVQKDMNKLFNFSKR